MFGALKSVRIITHFNGTPKGIAYVEFDTEEAATRALAADGTKIRSTISYLYKVNNEKIKNGRFLYNFQILLQAKQVKTNQHEQRTIQSKMHQM